MQIEFSINEQMIRITDIITIEWIIPTFSRETVDDNADNMIFPNTEVLPMFSRLEDQ